MVKRNIRWITWSINTWKTYFCHSIQTLAIKLKINVVYISCDEIRRDILYYSHNKNDVIIRQKIIQNLWIDIIWEQDMIDPIRLWNKIFYEKNSMKIYENIILPRMRQKIQSIVSKTDKKTLILVERAALLENNLQDMVHNQIIVLYCNIGTQWQRFQLMDIPREQIKKRMKYFWTIEKKQKICKDYDHCLFIDTSQWLSHQKKNHILHYMLQNA